MTLADAKAENSRIQALAREGVDFQKQAERERIKQSAAEKLERASNLPFQDMFAAWVSDGVARADSNAELRRSFNKDILPLIGEKPVRDVSEMDLREALRKVGRGRECGRAAEVLLSDLRQLFRWAEKRQPWRGLLVEGNPAELVDLKQIVQPDYNTDPRERILLPEELQELRSIFAQIESTYAIAQDRRTAVRPVRRETQIALWLCLSTTCRIGELLKARWEDIDLKAGEWLVPAENTKTGAKWRVFLSPFALCQFNELHALTGDSPWCFPSRNKEGTHLYEKSVSKQVGDRQAQFKKRTKQLKKRRQDNTLVLSNGSRGEWTPHDLRRTGSTFMQALGIRPEVIDRCQNHVLPGGKIRRTYQRHDYAKETRAAWLKLGHRIEAILR